MCVRERKCMCMLASTCLSEVKVVAIFPSLLVTWDLRGYVRAGPKRVFRECMDCIRAQVTERLPT